MGFFDRLGNLGKGMLRVWSDPESRRRERDRRLAALEAEWTRLVKNSSADRQSFLDKLEQAWRDGVLTEPEYRRKRAEYLARGAAEAPAGAADADSAGETPETAPGNSDPPDPDSPIRRTL